MQQSNVIFATLLIAFVVFITVRGELPTYLSLLRGAGGGSGAASNTPLATGQNLLNQAQTELNSYQPTGTVSSGGMTNTQAQQVIDIFGGE